MTRAELQALIDSTSAAGGGEVIVPTAIAVDVPLVLKPGVTVNCNNMHLTGPVAPNRIPIFQTAANVSVSANVINGNLHYGGILFPTLPVGAAYYPYFCTFENLSISGAPYGFSNNASGAWEIQFKRILVASCDVGFLHYGGTTFTFENCLVGGGVGWDLRNCMTVVLTNCAHEHCTSTTYASMSFWNCTGLTINNWHMEYNVSRGGPIVWFKNCDGMVVNGFFTVANKLELAAGQTQACIVEFDGCRGSWNGTIGGATVAANGVPRAPQHCDVGGGDATAANWVASMRLRNRNRLLLTGVILAPDALNSWPGSRYAIVDESTAGSVIASSACDIGPNVI